MSVTVNVSNVKIHLIESVINVIIKNNVCIKIVSAITVIIYVINCKFNYQNCKCLLEYEEVKGELLIYIFRSCDKYWEAKLNNEPKNSFANIFGEQFQ